MGCPCKDKVKKAASEAVKRARALREKLMKGK